MLLAQRVAILESNVDEIRKSLGKAVKASAEARLEHAQLQAADIITKLTSMQCACKVELSAINESGYDKVTLAVEHSALAAESQIKYASNKLITSLAVLIKSVDSDC